MLSSRNFEYSEIAHLKFLLAKSAHVRFHSNQALNMLIDACVVCIEKFLLRVPVSFFQPLKNQPLFNVSEFECKFFFFIRRAASVIARAKAKALKPARV